MAMCGPARACWAATKTALFFYRKGEGDSAGPGKPTKVRR